MPHLWEIKSYESLPLEELYAVLQLRSEVFVVEQNCAYQDLDGWDEKAMHLFLLLEKKMAAYCRIFETGVKLQNSASIGRVVVHPNFRNQGWGKELMLRALNFLEQNNTQRVTISAQSYLQKFYEELGFEDCGKSYLEDGIPHLEMRYVFALS